MKSKGKWIGKARAKMKKHGTLGSYGHHDEKTMKHDIAKGGKRGKKALFAMNMKKISSKRHHKAHKRTGRK